MVVGVSGSVVVGADVVAGVSVVGGAVVGGNVVGGNVVGAGPDDTINVTLCPPARNVLASGSVPMARPVGTESEKSLRCVTV